MSRGLSSESRDTLLTQSIEVTSFVHHYGMSEAEAMELVGIAPDELLPHGIGASCLPYLPRPIDIERITAALRSGDLIVGASSHQFRLIQSAKCSGSEQEETGSVDDFDDDSILDSDPVMPSWFRGSRR